MIFCINFLIGATGFPKDKIELQPGKGVKWTINIPPFITSALVCDIVAVDATKSSLIVIQPKPIVFITTQKEVTVGASPDALDDDEDCIEVLVKLICANTIGKIDKEYLTIKIKKPDDDIVEDPHFRQTVIGKDENDKTVQNTICYDLIGKSGDKFQLISDKVQSKSSLLLGDKYTVYQFYTVEY